MRVSEQHNITAASLGSKEFRTDYGIKYAYLAGAMYKGIASKELVVAMGRAELMGFFGSGGLSFEELEAAIRYIQSALRPGLAFGVNLLCHLERPEMEERTVDILLKYGVRHVEAAAFMRVTPSLVRYRLQNLSRNARGAIEVPNRVVAKVSRPEVATVFLQPPPEAMVRDLLQSGGITPSAAELSGSVPMCDDVCVEADSGGHTDGGVAYALMPAMLVLRDRMMRQYSYPKKVRLGAAGGIGTPHAAAAAFIMGAEFILTGSINQCTVEAGTSDAVKDLLQELNVQDTDYAPAGDMFELGARVQVAKKGLFFPSRANKLYELYQRHGSLDEIDPKTKQQVQEKYFQCSFEDVWEQMKTYYRGVNPKRIEDAGRNPKQKMALVFKWYFAHTTKLAMEGRRDRIVDFQIHCGPALGAFNQWVKGTPRENWRDRRVADIAEHLMRETALLLTRRFNGFTAPDDARDFNTFEQPL